MDSGIDEQSNPRRRVFPILDGISIPGIFHFPVIAAQKARSSASGLYVTFYYIGGSVGGLVPGLFWARGGWLFCVGLVIAVQMVTALIAWTRWRE